MEQRIIKFRAKMLNTNEWVEGDLVHIGKRVCIGGDHLKDGITPVDPSTVCQYTGLKDKEGKEIWEGDFLRCEIFYVVAGYVAYNEKKACFCVEDQDNGEYVSLEEIINACTDGETAELLVMGNKFDKENKS